MSGEVLRPVIPRTSTRRPSESFADCSARFPTTRTTSVEGLIGDDEYAEPYLLYNL